MMRVVVALVRSLARWVGILESSFRLCGLLREELMSGLPCGILRGVCLCCISGPEGGCAGVVGSEYVDGRSGLVSGF